METSADEDYWNLANAEIRKVFAALSSFPDLTSEDQSFIEHASRFGRGEPILNYPQWSGELGRLRDKVLRSQGDPRIAQIVSGLTELIWKWEYGAMENAGHLRTLELSSLANQLKERPAEGESP